MRNPTREIGPYPASAARSVKTTSWPPFERALDSALVTLTADDVVFR
jgi:hypothetical protein